MKKHIHPAPSHPVHYKGRKLHFMGHDLSRAAGRYGTPSYVYSFERVLQKLKSLRESFEGPLSIHYAMKANSNPELLRRLARQGVGVDVVSGGEIARALECGFSPKGIIFSGVGKSEVEILFALKTKIHVFNVESPQELERIGRLAGRLGVKAAVSFRINPNVNSHTHPYVTTGFRENKFGMDKSFLPELLQTLRRHKKSLKLVGLDFHLGSQMTKLAPFVAALKKSIPLYGDLQRLGHSMEFFDVGGGIGIPYHGEKVIEIHDYGRAVEALLRPLGCKILCEPGRFLVGDAGVLLSRIEYVKKTPYKTFYIVNTGMHQLLRPALYHSHHEILPLNKTPGPLVKADVVGPICESSDWIAQSRPLPRLKQNDTLAILDAGAYGYSMASDYNLQARPSEIIID